MRNNLHGPLDHRRSVRRGASSAWKLHTAISYTATSQKRLRENYINNPTHGPNQLSEQADFLGSPLIPLPIVVVPSHYTGHTLKGSRPHNLGEGLVELLPER